MLNFKILNDFLTTIKIKLFGNKSSNLTGRYKQKINNFGGFLTRRNELTISENPVRSTELARDLIEIRDYSRYGRFASSYLAGDVFASNDGDDRGWTIAETLDDNITKIDPEIYDTIMQLIYKRFQGEWVVGGSKLEKAVREMVCYGDSFLEIGFNKDIRNGIQQTRFLPCWEMFRNTNEVGDLISYEQKTFNKDDSIIFNPIQIVQFSYERQKGYGESLFAQSRQDWAYLKQEAFNLAKAMRDVSVSPLIHEMPEHFDREARQAYQDEYESLIGDGIITNLFLDSGVKISRLLGNNNTLREKLDYWLQLRKIMIPPGFPIWLFSEFETTGAKDISGQPALTYKRLRNRFCSALSEGIRKIIDIELVCKLGYEKWQQKGQYRIIFPKWDTTLGETEDNKKGIEDLDDIESKNGYLKLNELLTKK